MQMPTRDGPDATPRPGAPDPLERNLLGQTEALALDGRIDVDRWAGGIAEQRAEVPSIRLGRRWVSTLWLVPLLGLVLLGSIALAQQLRTYSWMRDFLHEYPGSSASYAASVDSGFPWWLRWQHLFNLVFMMFIIRAGLQILADHPRLSLDAGSRPGREWLRMRGPVPADRMDPDEPERAWTAKDDSVALPGWIGIPGFRHSIGLARWWHFSFDLLWVLNGVLFFVLLFATDQWRRVVPQSLDVFPNALSTAIQYASLDFPANNSFSRYNGLQMLAYFFTIFIAAPLAFVTGLLQAPAIAGRLGLGAGWLNRQVVRTVHFGVLVWMVVFIAVHTVMVWTTGLLGNLNHITLGTNTESWWALAIYAVAMVGVIVLWVRATPFTIRHPRVVARAGELLLGRLARLMEWWDPRSTYREQDISPFLWPNGQLPDSEEYRALLAGGFEDFKLRIDGLVDRPVELTYAELKAMPKREQITQHYCIQGWSGIAKWGGVAMADLLELVGPRPEAKWVVFYSFGAGPEAGVYYDCHSIENMHHELTILAYEMNGEPLDELYGAPLRVRDEVELGFKQVKWVRAVELVESFEHLGAGQGGYNEDQEFFGYRAPI